MSLPFNMLSRFDVAFPPRSNSLNFMAVVSVRGEFGAQKRKSVTISTLSPSICHEVMGLDGTGSVFSLLSFKPAFSLGVKYFCTVMKKYTV